MPTDAEKIRRVREWPLRPYLPMIRRQDPEPADLGLLIEGEGPRVVRLAIFEVNGRAPLELAGEPVTEYTSVEEMLADGWQVD